MQGIRLAKDSPYRLNACDIKYPAPRRRYKEVHIARGNVLLRTSDFDFAFVWIPVFYASASICAAVCLFLLSRTLMTECAETLKLVLVVFTCYTFVTLLILGLLGTCILRRIVFNRVRKA